MNRNQKITLHLQRFLLRLIVIPILLTEAAFLSLYMHPESSSATTFLIRRNESLSPSSLSTLVMLASTTDDRSMARDLVFRGMENFRHGDILGSIHCFNEAEQIQGSTLTPYLWQRGISYYYINDYAKASQQFRSDVRVNPADTEEIVWDIASQLRLFPNKFPVSNQLSLPAGIRDRRRIRPTVYRLFRGEGSEQDLAVAGHGVGASISDEFYSLFYLGLFCEARGETAKAESYMRQAVQTKYASGLGRGDYMTTCARIHCKLRGWDG